jgi:uncharacterized protein YbjT (DUF2867 family)
MTKRRFLVTAATAPVGRSIVQQLVDGGYGQVRALSLAAAFDGVTAAFLLAVAPGVAPGFISAARTAGARRIVFQSSRAIDDDAVEQPNEVAAFHHDIERQLAASGLQWTFLRLEVASSDALQWAFDVPGQLANGDVVRGPYADAAGSPIHPADFAAVAVAALAGDEHAGKVYQLTGPRSLTNAEQVRLIGEAHGRTLRYEELDPAGARAAISRYAPADLLLDTWQRYRHQPAPVTDAVRQITGRPARTVEEWAAAYPI